MALHNRAAAFIKHSNSTLECLQVWARVDATCRSSAGYALGAVRIEAGEHEFLFHYRPWSLRLGALPSALVAPSAYAPRDTNAAALRRDGCLRECARCKCSYAALAHNYNGLRGAPATEFTHGLLHQNVQIRSQQLLFARLRGIGMAVARHLPACQPGQHGGPDMLERMRGALAALRHRPVVMSSELLGGTG